jgi:hypothetical protein
VKPTRTPGNDSRKRGGGRRWLWITLGLLAVALILALALLPGLFDIEQYRGRIEQALRDSTGWDAELGEMDLSLLRGLSLTISPARLGAPQGGSAAAISRIGIRADLLPLLRGELEVRRIDIVRPEIELVKENSTEGWRLPAQDSSAGGGDAALALSIDEVRLKRGRLRLEDRTAEPPIVIEIEELDISLFVADGRMEGGGELPNDGGSIGFRGRLEEGLTFDLSGLRTEALVPLVGDDLVRDGGRLNGSIDLHLPERIAGRLAGSGIALAAGEEALQEMALEFDLSEDDGGWLAEQLRIEADGATIEGSGRLSPGLALTLDLPATPLDVALGAAEALFPLPLDLEPPGNVTALIQLDRPDGGELTYRASGELSATRFNPGAPLPPVSDVRASYQLEREGRLIVDILESSVGGGPLAGRAVLDRVDPPGTLSLEGDLREAALGKLLSGFVAEAEERINGPTGLQADLRLDLSGGEIDATALRGGLELESRPVSLPGWDLRGAVQRKINEKRSSLSGLAALLDKEMAEEEAEEGEDPLFERMEAEVDFNQLPWSLERFSLHSGRLSASGSGNFDPSKGSVEILFTVTLDAEETAELVGDSRELRLLLDDRGRLALPVTVSGPLLGPSINVDLERMLSRRFGAEKREEAVKGLLKKLLD